MAKKTAKSSTSVTQGRTAREEQWRRRVAAQSQRNVQMNAAATRDYSEEAVDIPVSTGTAMPSVVEARTTVIRPTSAPQDRRAAVAAPQNAVQRRAAAAGAMSSRTTRTRLATNTLSVDEEMGYIKSDIRRLIILTAICLAIIVILSFVVR
ncbi:MAG: hypothetical protein M3014_14070 [Chloroflexota bacterium]|nr:hypothetical protein [Chloroflexota bacterium]